MTVLVLLAGTAGAQSIAADVAACHRVAMYDNSRSLLIVELALKYAQLRVGYQIERIDLSGPINQPSPLVFSRRSRFKHRI